MDIVAAENFINTLVDESVIPALMDFIRIPSLSPEYDPEWETNGHMDRALQLEIDWMLAQNIQGLKYEVIREAGKAPVLFIEVDPTAEGKGTVLMYGHADKQPHMTGWMDGLGPTDPKIIDGKLYGRGGADDGYSLFGCITVLKTLQLQNLPHGRVVIVIENEEESGSPNLIYYIQRLKDRIGTPEIIFCLDSGAGNYEQYWVTASLRGVINFLLTAKVLNSGQHSGSASGIVPSSFRILRILLDRIEDTRTGELKVPELFTQLSPDLYKKLAYAAETLGEANIIGEMPWAEGVQPVTRDLVQLIINRTWKPTLSTVGAAGFPPAATAGNVLRAESTLKISIRIPPKVDAQASVTRVMEILTENPPYNAQVTCTHPGAGNGFAAPDMQPWLEEAIQEASNTFFQKPAVFFGEGGSIPFMGMLASMYPDAQFVVSGILGPGNNAHSSNENLVIPYLKKFLCCTAFILAKHGAH